MNYYSHNIGDYAQATIHLSLIEDAVYSRLLRRYYAEEAPLVNDMAQLCRWVGARSDEEKDAVEVVVNEFFVLHDGYWHNKRADREIDAYQAKSIKASESAAKRWHSNKSPKEDAHKCERNANAMRTQCEPNANQEPITNNHNKDICANGFARFWDAYPKKKSKGTAEKVFLKIKPSEQLLESMLESIELAKTSDDWKKDNGQFIPYPATWLNARGWEDDAGAMPAEQDSIFAGAI